MKVFWIVLGVLLIAFGAGQVLQLLGFIGTKSFGLPGIAFTIMGFALGVGCFKKALGSPSK